jgi:CRISPR-associated exonuclease Cas4
VYSEDELLPISALQHLAFCERQWALIHLEGAWEENRLTAEGRVLHDRAHQAQTESRGDIRIARGLRLHSLRLGLTGVADVVEFHRPDAFADAGRSVLSESDRRPGVERAASQNIDVPSAGVRLPGARGLWAPFPVEYKRGRPKLGPHDEIQLCAQALCLEEMLGVSIPRAALFYGKPMRRTEVSLDGALREQTERLALRLHELARLAVTPPPIYGKKCESCSLLSLCMPKRLSKMPSVGTYINSVFRESEG